MALDDIEAINQLKARYFRTMDTKDWDGMRQVFTDDVVMDTTESGGGVVTGADEFMAFLREALDGAVTVHQGHMPEIDLTSETTATGIWALNDIVIWPNGMRPRRLRALRRDLREERRRVADQVVEAHPAAHRLRDARGDLMPVAVVTGGASGLGLALGERCAALGMDVALLDLDGERAAAEQLRVAEAHKVAAFGGQARRRRDAASVEAGASDVDERLRRHRSWSNVGVQLFGAVESFTDDEWRWLLDVNVTGRINGPYTLTNLTILDLRYSNTPAVWQASNQYVTSPYNWADFAATCFVMSATARPAGSIGVNPRRTATGGLQYA